MIGASSARLHLATFPVSVAIVGSGFFPTIVAAALGQVNFAADDGLDVALAGFIEEIGGSEEVAMVGDSHGRHFLARSFVEQLGGLASPVEKTEIRVDVEMNELRLTHGTRL